MSEVENPGSSCVLSPNSSHFDYLQALEEGFYDKENAKRITLRVTDESQLHQHLIKTDSTRVAIPEFEFEDAEGVGFYGTIHTYLERVKHNLERLSFVTEETLNAIDNMLTCAKPYTLIFDDALGNTTLEREGSDDSITVERYPRTWSQKKDYDLGEPIEQFIDAEGEDKLLELISQSSKIVALTGAGISTESGIPAFRSHDGSDTIWSRYSQADSHLANFVNDVESRKRHWEMKLALHDIMVAAEPNASHKLFVELQKLGKLKLMITQNIDELFQHAGVDDDLIVEIHGSNMKISCMACGKRVDDVNEFHEAQKRGEISFDPRCTNCNESGNLLKPETIFFGEKIKSELLQRSQEALQDCDLVIVMGTSLVVQPANSFPVTALDNGAKLVLINKGDTMYDSSATVHITHKTCGEAAASILDRLTR